jgi:hypothetical protein
LAFNLQEITYRERFQSKWCIRILERKSKRRRGCKNLHIEELRNIYV